MNPNNPHGAHRGMPVSPMVAIWCRDDFETCAAEAMALTKPEQPAAPVVDLFTREVVR